MKLMNFVRLLINQTMLVVSIFRKKLQLIIQKTITLINLLVAQVHPENLKALIKKYQDYEMKIPLWKFIFIIPFQKLWNLTAKACGPVINKCSQFLTPQRILVLTIIFSVGSIIGIQFQKTLKSFEEKMNSSSRNPASVEAEVRELIDQQYKKEIDTYRRRPYAMLAEKQLAIDAIYLPLIDTTTTSSDKVTRIRSVTVDMILLASNRYLKTYFEEREYLLRDKFNVDFEIIDGDFPYTDEGKRILEQKMLIMLNQLIQDLNLDGKFIDLQITNFNAG